MLTKPQIQRLKQLTNGLEVGAVLGNRVLVKTVEPYTEMDRIEKEGILFVPETAREENTPLPTTGIVVAVSADAEVYDEAKEARLQEGDMVLFSKYAGTDVYLNEEAFRILNIPEILCTLVESKKSAGGPVVVPFNPDRIPQNFPPENVG